MTNPVVWRDVAAVLFDLDGTLLDSAPDLGAAANAMLHARGLPELPLPAYRPVASAGARGILGLAFGITPEAASYPALCDEFLSNYERGLMQRSVAFDGVPALVAHLERHALPWGVVTNKLTRFTVPLTQGLPWFAGAGTVVCGDTTPHAKPHPAPLLEAARCLGVPPAACIYVGDDERDIVAGLAAGMRTVAAAYGYLGSQPDLDRWGAHAQIATPLALLALLDKL